MPTYIALLRGINVGGHNKIKMADLKKAFESLGFENVRTLLQSGNVIFTAPRQSTSVLESQLEKETNARFGLTIDYVVRSAADWKKIIANNPFEEEAAHDPGHLVVACAKTKVRDGIVKTLQAAIKGRETARAVGGELYITYPDGIGTSKLTNAVIERTLGGRVTARNWNTVLKLDALTDAT